VVAVQQIRFSMKYGKRSIFFIMNMDLALVIFWLPHNCPSEMVSWHYPGDGSEVEVSPWCRTSLVVATGMIAAWTGVALLARELVN